MSRGDAVDGEDGEPGVFSGSGPEEVTGGGAEEGAGDEGEGKRRFEDGLHPDRAGEGGEEVICFRHAEPREPDGCEDVGGEECQQQGHVKKGRLSVH